MSEDEERQYIRASIEAVEKATGKRPIGWSGPDFQETPNTPILLTAEGRRTINEVNLLWREWFDGLYADGAITGRLMVLHLHPWIMGQRGLTMARSDRSRLKMR
jgi:peptidoglycan/xylan/chitin deacetylase (PgdA/CDA1 family)